MPDYKLIYNPKKFDGKINKAKINTIYAKREGGIPSGKIMEKPGLYAIAPNELKKFRSDIADYLLRKYRFLQEVKPDRVDEVLKEMKEKKYKCQLCDFATDTRVALAGHMKSHKLSEEAQEILAKIPETKPEAFVVGAEHSGTGQTEFIDAEQAEGVPTTFSDDPRRKGPVDREGVEWYGKGVQQIRRGRGGQRPVIRRGTPGQRPTRRPAFQT